MPINPDAVGAKGDPVKHSWTSKDALLYAVGVGAGAVDPLDELAFTTENTNGRRRSRCCRPWPSCSASAAPAPSARSARSTRRCSSTASRPSRCTARSPSRARSRPSARSPASTTRARARWSRRSPCRPLVATGEPLFTSTHRRRSSAARAAAAATVARRARRTSPPERAARPHRSPTRPATDQALLYRLSRRPQPAALGPGLRRDGRLRPADPPRPVHLRLHRPGAAAHAVRLDPARFTVDGRPVLVAGHARRGAHREDVGHRRRRGRLPDPRRRRPRRPRRRRAAPFGDADA